MKINDIINEGVYDASPFSKKMGEIARKLDKFSQGSGEPGSLKKMSDEELGLMNKAGSLASSLGGVGSSFGIKDPSQGSGDPKAKLAKFFQELEAKSGVDKATITKLFKIADEMGDSKVAMPEPQIEPNDEPEDEFAAPDDDEIARQADARAAKRR